MTPHFPSGIELGKYYSRGQHPAGHSSGVVFLSVASSHATPLPWAPLYLIKRNLFNQKRRPLPGGHFAGPAHRHRDVRRGRGRCSRGRRGCPRALMDGRRPHSVHLAVCAWTCSASDAHCLLHMLYGMCPAWVRGAPSTHAFIHLLLTAPILQKLVHPDRGWSHLRWCERA